MGEYLLMLTLVYGPPAPPEDEEEGEANAQHATIADALEQSRTASWMRLADINAYELSYIVTGKAMAMSIPAIAPRT